MGDFPLYARVILGTIFICAALLTSIASFAMWQSTKCEDKDEFTLIVRFLSGFMAMLALISWFSLFVLAFGGLG